MANNVVEVTDGNFEQEVLKSDVPVLVDFWAEWCGPCLMQAPTLEQLAEEYQGRIKVAKIDTDANRSTALKFGIQAIPTIMLFKNGNVEKRWTGLTSKKVFKEALDAVL